jgi:hypothetical protein
MISTPFYRNYSWYCPDLRACRTKCQKSFRIKGHAYELFYAIVYVVPDLLAFFTVKSHFVVSHLECSGASFSVAVLHYLLVKSESYLL